MKSLIVVEDNPDNRMLVEALLEDLYQLESFASGARALEAMEMRPTLPDVVLLDISLPGIDGVEVLSRMRSSEKLRGIPVIALTAHAMEGDRERFLEQGFDEYVSKPIVDEELLLGAIENCLALGG